MTSSLCSENDTQLKEYISTENVTVYLRYKNSPPTNIGGESDV